jgi:hypothetical protein
MVGRERARRAVARATPIVAMIAAAISAATVCATSCPALAQDARAGRDAYLAADFPGAASSFERVIASQRATRADALDAHRHLATLRFVLGDRDAAFAHAAAAITLDRDVEPAEGSPGEVATIFDAARRAMGDRGSLELRMDSAAVVAELTPWPSAIDARLELRCGDEHTEARPPRARLTLGGGGSTRCVAALRPSEGRAAWLEIEHTFSGPGTTASAAVASTDDADRGAGGDDPLPWILLGVGAAVVAAAVIVAVVVLTSQPSQASFGPTMVPGW